MPSSLRASGAARSRRPSRAAPPRTASANDVASSAISEARRFSAIAMSISSCRNCSSTVSAFSRTASRADASSSRSLSSLSWRRARVARLAAFGACLQLVDVSADLRPCVVNRLCRHAYLLSSSDVTPRRQACRGRLPTPCHATTPSLPLAEWRAMRRYGVRAVSAPVDTAALPPGCPRSSRPARAAVPGSSASARNRLSRASCGRCLSDHSSALR